MFRQESHPVLFPTFPKNSNCHIQSRLKVD
jgi:hypothetical protein